MNRQNAEEMAQEFANTTFRRCIHNDDGMCCACVAHYAAEMIAQVYADGERAGAERERAECAELVRDFADRPGDWRAGRQLTNGRKDRDCAIADAIRRRANESEGGR